MGIYCESSTGSRFTVYEGIVLPTRDLQWFDDLLRDVANAAQAGRTEVGVDPR